MHGVVRGPVQEDHAIATSEEGKNAAVEDGGCRVYQNVRGTDKLGKLPLELFVYLRGGDSPGPARMHSPTLYRLGDRGLNRRVQIQTQVVRGREISVPAPVDLDVPAVLLAHDGAELRDLAEYQLLKPGESVGRRRIRCANFGGFAHHAADVFHRPQIGDDRIAQPHLESRLHFDHQLSDGQRVEPQIPIKGVGELRGLRASPSPNEVSNDGENVIGLCFVETSRRNPGTHGPRPAILLARTGRQYISRHDRQSTV